MKIQRICDIAGTLYFLSAHWCYYLSLFKIKVHYNALIELCVDICKRNGKNKLLWFGDKIKTLNYAPKSGEMVLTVHRWFANKSCPGDWMYSRMGDLAKSVTERLSGVSGGGSTTIPPTEKTLYRVRKSWSEAKSQIGAFSVLTNAKSLVDKNPSYKVFDESGKVVYEKGSTSTAFKPYTVRVTATDLYIRRGVARTTAQTVLSRRVSIPSWQSRAVRGLPSGAS